MAFLLYRFGLRPRRRWGQHFLTDRRIAGRIAEAAGLGEGDRVVEVGPGLGALTLALARPGVSVVAVERDPQLAGALAWVLAEWAGPDRLGRDVFVVVADILTVDLSRLLVGTRGEPARSAAGRPGVLAANLPYGITSPFLLQLTRAHGWRRAVVMVQKEVGERLSARPGEPAYGSLTVAVQARCRVQALFHVARRSFWPPPEVDSVVVALEPAGPPLPPRLARALEQVLRAGFGQRRKTLRNALATLAAEGPGVARAVALLEAAGIDPGRRAETLDTGEFLRLAALWAGVEETAP